MVKLKMLFHSEDDYPNSKSLYDCDSNQILNKNRFLVVKEKDYLKKIQFDIQSNNKIFISNIFKEELFFKIEKKVQK